MNSSNGIVLWSLGAAGTLLVYSAFKNVKPQAVLAHYFTGAAFSNSDKIQAASAGGGKPLIQATTPGGTPINQTPNLNNLNPFKTPPPSKTNGGNSDYAPRNSDGFPKQVPGILGGILNPANFGSPTYLGS